MAKKEDECKSKSFYEWLDELVRDGVMPKNIADEVRSGVSSEESYLKEVYSGVIDIDSQICSLTKEKRKLIKKKNELEYALEELKRQKKRS